MKNKFTMEELVPIVAGLTEKYTSKESSSITVETARQLMGAVLYCMEQEPETAAGNLSPVALELDPQETYERGCQIVLDKVKSCRKLWEDICRDFFSYGNRTYQETVIDGMREFFRWYDPKFCPQNEILTLDYPVLVSLEEIQGVDRILAYLKVVQLEQRFLKGLPAEFCQETLIRYHNDFEELMINLPFILFEAIIIEALSQREGAKIEQDHIEEAGNVFLEKVFPGDQELKVYFKDSYHEMAVEHQLGRTGWILENK